MTRGRVASLEAFTPGTSYPLAPLLIAPTSSTRIIAEDQASIGYASGSIAKEEPSILIVLVYHLHSTPFSVLSVTIVSRV